MLLTERMQVGWSRALFDLCHAAKDLYNRANYVVRQQFFKDGRRVLYGELDALLKRELAYRMLPAQTSQQTLRLLDKNWKSFDEAMKEWKVHPDRFLGMPRPPGYKDKDGESIATFTNQNAKVRDGHVRFPKKCGIPPIKTRIGEFHQVRVIPRGSSYVVEVVHEKEVRERARDPSRAIAMDIGVNNLVACVNNVGLAPFLISGGAAKSINQYYNKERARLQSAKDLRGCRRDSTRMRRLAAKRNDKVRDYFHKASKYAIDYCERNAIGTIVVGYNEKWKQGVNLGRRGNQNFVQLPHARLVQMIRYKAELAGIRVVEVEESHTSKCSALDGEPICHHDAYAGKRVKRGLFVSEGGVAINADVNGAYNIMRKAVPESLRGYGIEGLALVPRFVAI